MRVWLILLPAQFDGLALHWYGTSAKEFTDYLVSFHNDFGLDIWVTEFACQVAIIISHKLDLLTSSSV